MQVDWAELIARLERRYTHAQIAKAVGRHKNWVGQLKRGDIKEPPFSVGCDLISLDEYPDCTETQQIVQVSE